MAFEFPSPAVTHDTYATDKAKWSWTGVSWQRGTLLKPTVTAIAPATEWHGDPAFTLTVTGTGFAADSKIVYNGAEVTTVYVSPTSLTAQITPPVSAAVTTTATVNVADASTADLLLTYTSRPIAISLDPTGAGQGDPAFTLTVTGNYFTASTQVVYNGAPIATGFYSQWTINCSVTPPAVGGATSATVNVTDSVSPDLTLAFGVKPVITSITAIDNDHAPGTMENVYVFANNIVSGDVINLNGVDLATTWRTTYLEAKIDGSTFADGNYPVFIKHGAIHSDPFNVYIG
jgi:hypothetical protein